MIKYSFEHIGLTSNFHLSSMRAVNMVIVNTGFYPSTCGAKLRLSYCFYLFLLHGSLRRCMVFHLSRTWTLGDVDIGPNFSRWFYNCIPVSQLSSWNLSVSTGKISADVQWTALPLNEHIENLWLRFKDVDGDVSVLIPVDENDDSYHINNLLKTSTNYIFDLVAFTGDFGISQGFSSQNATVATLEGGAF